MTQKLILAEGLDLLRRTEAREYEVDRSQVRISSSNKYRNELGRLAQAYGVVYADYLRGVEIINYVRRCAMESSDVNSRSLVEMCEGKMRVYMDRCDGVRKKEDNILLPLEQVDTHLVKAAFEVAEPVFMLNGAQYKLTRKEPFMREEQLGDGSYLLVVKNLDSYGIAAPLVTVVVDIIPQRGQQQRLEKEIPCQCGWRRVIGVVGKSTLRVMARTDGLVRDSHVDITLYNLERETSTTSTNSKTMRIEGNYNDAPGAMAEKIVQQLPKLTDEELEILANSKVPTGELPGKAPNSDEPKNTKVTMQQLQSLNVPHIGGNATTPLVVPERIEVNPAKMNCSDRLKRLRMTLNAWPANNVMAVQLNREQQTILQAAFALPLPTELDD
ncbi:uncharacterized protein TM35_000361850 [Trypanosoma theileri]|uniref:Uncharacterized protein n=1 Tax=Trypanosoma theileri TaxID=67003 RepID=A0A1X0NKR8_9TRYP|nr:uncharacterized protein TM35_000361850 [Trypanosoma theileri]ORC85325.1 hypothetical protein TM35_000361850 [Trypanosoma theileri]